MEPKAALKDMKAELTQYKYEHSKTEKEYNRLRDVLNELKNHLTILEAKIQTANNFISFVEGVESHNKSITSVDNAQIDLSEEYAKLEPKQAYIDIAKKYYKDKVFRAKDIKKTGDEKGVRTINGELISSAYCRNIISLLVRNGDFEKIKAGLYKISDKHLNDIRQLHL